jgi:hypothetical protein
MGMRVSSLSQSEVIDLLSWYFVPVWLSVDDFGTHKSPADAALWEQIRKAMHCGNAGVVILAADGTPTDKLGIGPASDPEKLLQLLRKVVKEQQVRPRKPEAIRASAAPPRTPKAKSEGGMVLHLWAFAERGRAEDWLELTADDWSKLAPPKDARPGTSWEVPRPVADQIYRYFYPPSCNYWVENTKIERASLVATVLSVSPKEIRIAFQGAVALKHDATPNGKMPARIDATVIGTAKYDSTARKFTALQLVTDQADHAWSWQDKPAKTRAGFAVELVP